MNPDISSEEEKDAAVAQLARLKQMPPGSAEEDTAIGIVAAVADYIANRNGPEVVES